MEAIQQHRANSAEFARRLARLERNMGSPGRTKVCRMLVWLFPFNLPHRGRHLNVLPCHGLWLCLSSPSE